MQPISHKSPDPSRSQSPKAKPEKPTTHLFEGGSLNVDSVLNHKKVPQNPQDIEPQDHRKQAKDSQDVGEPKHHGELTQVRGQPKTHQQLGSPPKKDLLHRFQPLMDLDLKNTFLELPMIDVRLLITKALIENHFPQAYYKSLAYTFGLPTTGFTPETNTEIVLTQWALLDKHKDEIIDACKNPKFSQNVVADLIAKKTGLLLDVHLDPNETVRIILNGLNLMQEMLNKIPENTDPAIDRQNIINEFNRNIIFPQTNVKFHENFRQMRDYLFEQYQHNENHSVKGVSKQIQGAPGVVTIYEPIIQGNMSLEEKLARELVAYKKNAPPSDSTYMSASSFREHLYNGEGERKYLNSLDIKSNDPQDIVCNKFIQEAIDRGLLDRYIPKYSENDDPIKIFRADYAAYRFNVYRENKPETHGTRAFREYIFAEHPHSNEYETDKLFQVEIRSNGLSPYVPKYDPNTDVKKILQEEAIAFRLNNSRNEEQSIERKALKNYLESKMDILRQSFNLSFKPTPNIPNVDVDQEIAYILTDFLDEYFKDYKFKKP